MELEVESKNQVLAEAAGYARQLEAALADKDRRIADLETKLRHARPRKAK
jgi:hypothetical protein